MIVSVANPASASQAEEDTTGVMVGSGKEKKSGSKDVRYGARKATSKGVAVVATSSSGAEFLRNDVGRSSA